MSEPKRYMTLSLDAPYSSTPASYNTQDELLEAMDAYIEECEAQNDLTWSSTVRKFSLRIGE